MAIKRQSRYLKVPIALTNYSRERLLYQLAEPGYSLKTGTEKPILFSNITAIMAVAVLDTAITVARKSTHSKHPIGTCKPIDIYREIFWPMPQFDFIQSGLRTIRIESAAVMALDERLDSEFSRACELILNCSGRIIVTGMGKSGHIGKKIAATLASTGTPAFFVHPGEASHGDLGMITPQDIVLALSYSGTSNEILTLLPLFKRSGIKIISLTGNPKSILAEVSEVHINIAVETEACPFDLAPTASTTATLVMGDALAIALLEARGFTAEDFAFSHPGGTLGRKLLVRVVDIMHSGASIPSVNEDATLKQALLTMTEKGFGLTTVVDKKNQLLGIFTDGDLRRTIDKKIDISSALIRDLMNRNPKTVSNKAMAAEALKIMEDLKITALIVRDEQQCPVGVLHMHDLLRAGVV
jgi:arabinose-5-phosphate isomerase